VIMPPLQFFSIFGENMIKPRAFDFYTFATYLHPASQLRAGAKLRDSMDAIEVIARASAMCMVFSLDDFSKRYLPSAAQRASYLHYTIENKYRRSPENGGIPEILSESDIKELQESIHAFETSLQDELGKLPMFYCEDEKIGNLSVDKLLKGASNGYPEKIKKHLPPSCLTEIDESGKCLVYDRSTAAGFHMLRSVELTIRQYLLAIPGFIMPPLNRQNWGQYLDLLKQHSAGRDVTDHLYNIKDNYRNPLMHPEDTLEIDEAVSLFALCQSMNEMLIADMKKRGFVV
jgi:hypothetical protein